MRFIGENTCTLCGRKLDPSRKVALELDQRVNEYHDFGNVPESLSQGWFDFGPECVNKARKAARIALEREGIDYQLSGERK